MSHTPTPWVKTETAHGTWLVEDGKQDYDTTYILNLSEVTGIENQNFVFRACNVHDELVAALDKALNAIKIHQNFGSPIPNHVNEEITVILAKAEGK